jgi:hypothetical protein
MFAAIKHRISTALKLPCDWHFRKPKDCLGCKKHGSKHLAGIVWNHSESQPKGGWHFVNDQHSPIAQNFRIEPCLTDNDVITRKPDQEHCFEGLAKETSRIKVEVPWPSTDLGGHSSNHVDHAPSNNLS